jgi:type 1 glutamine amidotransferase
VRSPLNNPIGGLINKFIAAILATWLLVGAVIAAEKKPHIVLVVGTLHYSPELTMPVFAKELDRLGFRSTVIMGEGNPEKKTENVFPGIEALADADAAIFFMCFPKLRDAEWEAIENCLKAGKPVIGLRTANHAFKYPTWNNGFGRRAMGTPCIVHQSGTTDIKVVAEHATHPIMTHISKRARGSPGTLYLARLEKGCLPLPMGKGTGKPRLLKRAFGEIQVKRVETATVAWAWQNAWGGKAFYTSLGHPGDFADSAFTRMLVNSVCWATDTPLPGPDETIATWQIERVDKKRKK